MTTSISRKNAQNLYGLRTLGCKRALLRDAICSCHTQGRAVIVVAHRLSTNQSMDRISTLKGTIVEQGMHHGLPHDTGDCAGLRTRQPGGRIEE